MKSLLAPLFIAILTTIQLSQATAALRCNTLHRPQTNLELEMSDLVDTNLFMIESSGNAAKSVKQVQRDNSARLTALNKLPMRTTGWKTLSKTKAQELIDSIETHRVTGNQYRYERTDMEVGYCFGRATFVHLQALRLGYKKEQIRKLWVVGPMEADKVNWRYHVATAIRNTTGEWWVIDNSVGVPMTPRQWFREQMQMSTDQKLDFFVSQPEKFGPYAGKYSRLELGLDVSRKTDFYRGYFSDLMKHIQP